MDTVEALLKKAFSTDPGASDAVLALGLLLEGRTVKRPQGDDGGLVTMVGAKLASHKLTSQEANRIVEALVNAAMTPAASTGMLWALMKSGDRNALPAFQSLLKRTLVDSRRQPLAEQALQGLLSFGDDALPEIKYAAEHGAGEVQRAAQDYLDVFGRR